MSRNRIHFRTAIALITAALLTNIGFTALGSIFNYPDVLKEPSRVALERFHEHQAGVSFWFTILALSAALFAPIAIGVGKLRSDRYMKAAVPIGIAAAVVQVIGLSRWPLLVPGFAHDAVNGSPAAASARSTASRQQARSSAASSARRSVTCSPRHGHCSWCGASARGSPVGSSSDSERRPPS